MPKNLETLQKQLVLKQSPIWGEWGRSTRTQALEFARTYQTFLSQAKTERETVQVIKQIVRHKGTRQIQVFVNRDKSIALVRQGQKSLRAGLRIIVAHTDSPHLDLKLTPLYEEENLAFFKTHYYGGVKKYHWPTLPLALHGTIAKTDGSTVNLVIGEKPDEPIFMITDLLPHLAEKQLDKILKEAIEAEELNLLVGSIAAENKTKLAKDKIQAKVKLNILKILNQRYKISEADFVSAEIQAVPAGPARELGFDQSLIAAYGHDNRICCYTAVMALLNTTQKPTHTQVVLLSDREEIGSFGNTGMQANYFFDWISQLVGTNDRSAREVLKNSQAISADVTAGLDPDYKDVHDLHNVARIGYGIALERYTGARGKYATSEASAEYTAKIRKLFDENKIFWQPATLGKVDLGGGGTLAMHLARFNVDIIDLGPPVLNMHAPYEIASKADLFNTFQAYQAFLQS